MAKLAIDFSWESPGAAKGPELRATWAQFKLTVEGTPLTRVVDYRLRTVRDNLYLPLYPLAEWLATHWWWLFHEVESPSRSPRKPYESRHNLRYAREGYALPSLRIVPAGDSVLLEWHEGDLPDSRVRFLTSGEAVVEPRALQSQLAGLIEATLQRLDEQGVSGTLLHEEWQAIQTADAEEFAFCKAAAQLGMDAFNVSGDDEQAVLAAAVALPSPLADEFFSVARPEALALQAASIREAVAELSRLDVEMRSLVSLKAAMSAAAWAETPWQAGYDLARQLRRHLGLDGRIVKTAGELGDVLGVPADAWNASQLPFRQDCAFVDAVVAVNQRSGPGFLIEKRHENSRKFALCRALFEHLLPRAGSSALISDARSDRQKRNRAFAAEFLVPAALLRQLIPGDTISEEGVEQIASQFGTSSYVIHHQLTNHRIAEVVPAA